LIAFNCFCFELERYSILARLCFFFFGSKRAMAHCPSAALSLGLLSLTAIVLKVMGRFFSFPFCSFALVYKDSPSATKSLSIVPSPPSLQKKKNRTTFLHPIPEAFARCPSSLALPSHSSLPHFNFFFANVFDKQQCRRPLMPPVSRSPSLPIYLAS